MYTDSGQENLKEKDHYDNVDRNILWHTDPLLGNDHETKNDAAALVQQWKHCSRWCFLGGPLGDYEYSQNCRRICELCVVSLSFRDAFVLRFVEKDFPEAPLPYSSITAP
jgi:hypothetical protein